MAKIYVEYHADDMPSDDVLEYDSQSEAEASLRELLDDPEVSYAEIVQDEEWNR